MNIPKSQEVILEQLKDDIVWIVRDMAKCREAWNVAYVHVGIGPTADGAMLAVLADEQGVAVLLDDEEIGRIMKPE